MSDILGIILAIVATILRIFFSPIMYAYGLFKSAKAKKLGDYHKDLALSFDRLGNVMGQYLFDDLLITSSGLKFGDGTYTISSMLAQNKKINTLTVAGKALSWILIKLKDPAFLGN
jgi:hypothetical protein